MENISVLECSIHIINEFLACFSSVKKCIFKTMDGLMFYSILYYTYSKHICYFILIITILQCSCVYF